MIFVEEKDGLDVAAFQKAVLGAGQQGLPRVDRLHRADSRREVNAIR